MMEIDYNTQEIILLKNFLPKIGSVLKARNKKLRYEHAVPVGFAADYLIEAAFNKNVNFSEAFNLLKKNYKQVAFNEVDAKIIDRLAGKIGMPKGWNINKDSWTARYDVASKEINLDNLEWTAGSKNAFASKSINTTKEFASILEGTKGIAMEDVPSEISSRQRGRKKDTFKPFVPYSAEDFEGLMYALYGKGAVGDKNAQWFKDNFYKPLSEGLMIFDAAKQQALLNWQTARKQIKASGIDLSAESSVPGYTKEQALRVRMWYLKGYKIPGLTENEAKTLSNSVRQDFDSMQLMEKLDNIFEEKIYPEPGETNDWLAGTMLTDILDHVNDVTRKEYLAPFFNNVDEAIGVLGRGGMKTKIEASRMLTWKSAAESDAGIRNTESAAHAKRFAADTAMEVSTDAVQVFGGYGYSEEYPVAQLMRAAKVMQIYEGSSQVQRMIIGREITKDL